MGTAALGRRTRALLVAVVSASLLGLVAPSAVADDGAAPVDPRPTVVSGRAITPDGAPVAQMPVSLCTLTLVDYEATEPSDRCPSTTTNAHGSFAIPVEASTAEGDATRYVVMHSLSSAVSDLKLARTYPVDVSLTGVDVSAGDLVIQLAAHVRGVVMGPRGPITGAAITAWTGWSDASAPVYTDATGQFLMYVRDVDPLDSSRPRNSAIKIVAADHATTTTEFPVVPGGRHDIGTIHIPLDRSYDFRVTGTSAPASLIVQVTGPNGYTAKAARGNINATGLENGDYTITVGEHPTYYFDPVRFALSDDAKHAELSTPLLRFATATAQVRTPDGRPIDALAFRLEHLIDNRWTSSGEGPRSHDGSVDLTGLRAGTYRLVPSDSRIAAPLPSAAGFTVAAGESRDLGVLTVEPFAMGYRHDVTITTPTIERTRVYDPDRLSVITASVASAAPLEGVEAVVLDGAGREVTSTLVTQGKLRFLMTRSAVGTHAGFRIHIPATYQSNAATSALVPPHTITPRPTRVSTPRLSRSAVSRGGVVNVRVDVTHGDHGTLELLIDGKVAARTSMISQGPGTTHTHLLMAPAPAVGKHTIAVRRVATATDAAATSATATLTVTKATLRGRPKVSAKPFRAGTKPKVTVTVPQTKHRAYATGKVRLYVGKKLVRTVTLKAKHRGRITTTLPVRPTRSIKVRAVYVGSKDVAGATSKITTIKAKPKVRR